MQASQMRLRTMAQSHSEQHQFQRLEWRDGGSSKSADREGRYVVPAEHSHVDHANSPPSPAAEL
eukprot:3621859-Rhodomonas_salina.2